MREDEVNPRWARYRGSITWRKSSRTVSSPRSRFGASTSFTRDLGVIWRRRGQRRSPIPTPGFPIVFGFIDLSRNCNFVWSCFSSTGRTRWNWTRQCCLAWSKLFSVERASELQLDCCCCVCFCHWKPPFPLLFWTFLKWKWWRSYLFLPCPLSSYTNNMETKSSYIQWQKIGLILILTKSCCVLCSTISTPLNFPILICSLQTFDCWS